MVTDKLLAAAAVVLAYALFCAGIAWRHRRRRRAQAAAHGTLLAGDGPAVLVAYASQTGDAEEIAGETARALHAGGLPARLVPLAALEPASLAQAGTAVFVVSTTGEGDAPDNAVPFVHRVMAGEAPDLSDLDYGVLALGDRSYQDYCAFGRDLDRWLGDAGAQALHPPVLVDRRDPAALGRWAGHIAALGGQGLAVAERPFRPWRLVARQVLNPGSPGAAAVLVSLAPPQPEAWQAGDVAEIRVGPADAAGDAAVREYSIASLPGDGVIQLLVRQVVRPDGLPGLGSHWLTEGAVPGADIALRIRHNGPFHGPADPRPLILVGNGTGIAGLRAHLKERAALGHGRNWLLFGERTRAHDRFFADELAAWQRRGVLARLDCVFSRDGGGYVQQCLAAQADRLRDWVGQGAAIYVCGSLHGMAGGVAQVLEQVLGPEALDRLIVEGRYRRDVY